MLKCLRRLSWPGRLLLGLLLASALALLVPRTRALVPVALSLLLPGLGGTQQAGSVLTRPGPADALVVVSRRALSRAAEAADFDSALRSYAWVGLLEQELGTSAVLDVDDLRAEDLQARRVVVFTRSATIDSPPPGVLEAARSVAREGAAILLELPTSGWSSLSGLVLGPAPANPRGRVWRGQPLEFQEFPGSLRGAQMGPSLAVLREMPVFTWIAQGLMHDGSVRTLGRLSGQPLVYARPEGRGQVLSLGFDLACQVQALQQGAPAGPGFTVTERNGLVPGLVESQDLVLGPTMLDSVVPCADLLEGWMADLAEDAAGPLPGWWRFPFACDGLAVLSHDEEGRGREAFADLWALEARLGAPSTTFVLTGRDLPQLWPDPSRNLQLHWNRFMAGSWPPYEWLDLAGQVARLRALRGSRSLLNRNHYLAWGQEYDEPFRQMAAAGLELDSTYGPNRGRGYLFGTGLPFRVLDRDGLPLPVWEWPFVSQENWSGADAAFVQSLLQDSSRAWHQAPVVLLHPHRWVATPEGRQFLEGFVRQARALRHQVTTMEDYHGFLQMRSGARIRSRFHGGVLEADLEAPGPGLALRLPANLSQVQLDGRPARVRQVRLNDRLRLLVEVPPGAHRLRAVKGAGG